MRVDPVLNQDTIVALATPNGSGAIGIIRLSGPKAFAICNRHFKGKDLQAQASHTVHFGTFRDGDALVDEVLVSLFKGPNSYTGEDVVEISCHGSQFILGRVLDLLQQSGARMAQAGEFTLRAFLQGKMDLTQAEAVADLIASNSASSHATAMQQMRGGFSNELSALRQEFIDFASLIELELDFSEEDVEFADRSALVALVERIESVLKRLIESFELGNVIKEGVSTVIAGRPNAGKSTLLNALLNEERAIVSDIAGTTRDTIEEMLTINGVNFRIIDTAGIRDAEDAIEAIGVEKTMEKIHQSALLVYVYDASVMSRAAAMEDVAQLRTPMPVIVISNKADLLSEAQKAEHSSDWEGVQQVLLSAKTEGALGELQQVMFDCVMDEDFSLDNTVVTNSRHVSALRTAYDAMLQVRQGLNMHISGELLALDIRVALDALGEITGEVSNDDLLGNIFGRFCIGK